MKHLLEVLLDNGYVAYRYSFIFPNQNTSAKIQNLRILENKEKYKVKFMSGDENKGSFFFIPEYQINDFSTMRVGGIHTYFIKDNDFNNPIIWGLNEGDKPPTLIKPTLNAKLKRFNKNGDVEVLFGDRNDTVESVLKNNDHQFLFENLYNKDLNFEYDLTKNPTD